MRVPWSLTNLFRRLQGGDDRTDTSTCYALRADVSSCSVAYQYWNKISKACLVGFVMATIGTWIGVLAAWAGATSMLPLFVQALFIFFIPVAAPFVTGVLAAPVTARDALAIALAIYLGFVLTLYLVGLTPSLCRLYGCDEGWTVIFAMLYTAAALVAVPIIMILIALTAYAKGRLSRSSG
jgi:hypothetical protein